MPSQRHCVRLASERNGLHSAQLSRFGCDLRRERARGAHRRLCHLEQRVVTLETQTLLQVNPPRLEKAMGMGRRRCRDLSKSSLKRHHPYAAALPASVRHPTRNPVYTTGWFQQRLHRRSVDTSQKQKIPLRLLYETYINT